METTVLLLRRLRASGLSQTEIARRSGIPQSRLSRWEAGNVPAAADDVLRLAAMARDLIGAEPDAAPAQAAGSLPPPPGPAGQVAEARA